MQIPELKNFSTSIPSPHSTAEISSRAFWSKRRNTPLCLLRWEAGSTRLQMYKDYLTLAQTRLRSTPARLEDLASLKILRVVTVLKLSSSQSRQRGPREVGHAFVKA